MLWISASNSESKVRSLWRWHWKYCNSTSWEVSLNLYPTLALISLLTKAFNFSKISRLNIFCKLKLDINSFLPPKHYRYGGRFLLQVGYNIQPTSSTTNQNAALMIDHQLDFTNVSYTIMAKPIKSLELHYPMIQFFIIIIIKTIIASANIIIIFFFLSWISRAVLTGACYFRTTAWRKRSTSLSALTETLRLLHRYGFATQND